MLAGCRSGVNRGQGNQCGGWSHVSSELNDDEEMLVATVRAFIDRDVKPTVREVEHANTYPEAWIEQMKRIGIYGLAIPEAVRRVAGVDAVLCASHPGAGARLDEPGRRDGRAHRRCQAADAVRHRGTEADIPAADGHRRTARHHGTDRAGRRLRPAEHDHHRATGRYRRSRYLADQRLQDLDQQRAPFRIDCAAVQDRSQRHAASHRHLDRARRTRAGADGVARPAQAGLQGRRVLRAVVRQLRRAGVGRPGRPYGPRLFADDERP